MSASSSAWQGSGGVETNEDVVPPDQFMNVEIEFEAPPIISQVVDALERHDMKDKVLILGGRTG